MHPAYGLAYDSSFLRSLPVLHPSDNTVSNPARLLTAEAFGDLHLQHTLSHPPDNVLFPFLHGLEGDNHAQNAFFHSSAIGAPTKSYGSPATVNANSAARVWCQGRARVEPTKLRYIGDVCLMNLEIPRRMMKKMSARLSKKTIVLPLLLSFGEDESEDDIEVVRPNVVISKSEDAMMSSIPILAFLQSRNMLRITSSSLL